MSTQTLTPREVAGQPFPATGTYAIDANHSTVEAVARHLVVSKVRGSFGSFGGTVTVAERPEDSRVDVQIDAASIDTRSPDRDGHLRSPDFLDAEQHPTLTFASTAVRPAGDGWIVSGDLTIRGVTRPVDLRTTYLGTHDSPFGQTVAAWSAQTEITREEWGITWNAALESGGVLLGPKLKIELEIQAALQA